MYGNINNNREVSYTMVKKIKLSDLAKDLNVPGNDIADLMERISDTKKKPSSALTEEEINIILEHYTQQNQVASFDAYFEQRNHKSAGEKEKPAVSVIPRLYSAGLCV